MTKTATIEDAVLIAAQAHKGQKDLAGAPYLLHPMRLMMQMTSEAAMMTAVLHDVVEDTSWTIERLKEEGFSDEVLEAVDCLTRRKRETYESFINRVQTNAIATQVKIADLEDNMNIRRIDRITSKELERLEKYHRAWVLLSLSYPIESDLLTH